MTQKNYVLMSEAFHYITETMQDFRVLITWDMSKETHVTPAYHVAQQYQDLHDQCAIAIRMLAQHCGSRYIHRETFDRIKLLLTPMRQRHLNTRLRQMPQTP